MSRSSFLSLGLWSCAARSPQPRLGSPLWKTGTVVVFGLPVCQAEKARFTQGRSLPTCKSRSVAFYSHIRGVCVCVFSSPLNLTMVMLLMKMS